MPLSMKGLPGLKKIIIINKGKKREELSQHTNYIEGTKLKIPEV